MAILRHILLTIGSGKLLAATTIAMSLALSSCGGGSDTVTAGAGGSGIGGTGVTMVRGNVATVVAAIEPGGTVHERTMFAHMLNFISQPAVAQSSSVQGIVVSGGGKRGVTDSLGRFVLNGVVPSNSFTLIFTLKDGRQATMGIGPVVEGTTVEVKNVVVNVQRGNASSSEIQQQVNPGSQNNASPTGATSSGSEDDGSSDDDTSDDDDSDDDS